MTTKVCSRCSEEKSTTDFPKKSRNKDGLAAHCRDCQTAWNKSYYHKNKDAEKERHAKWREENYEHLRKWGMEYRSGKEEELREYCKKWRKENPDLVNYHSAKRRATERKATPDWLSDDQLSDIKAMYSLAKKFEGLCGIKYHVDHIVPLKGKNVCGLHVAWNMQLLPASSNIAKSNKYDPDSSITTGTT